MLATAFWWTGIGGGFLAVFVVPGLALWGLTIVIAQTYFAIRRRQTDAWKRVSVALLSVCLAPFVFAAISWTTIQLFDWGTFAVQYPSYRRIIALADQGRLPPPGKTAFQTAVDGTMFQAERKAPHRVAFPFPGGFLDNWTGILYDPASIGKRDYLRQKDGSSGDLLDNWWTIENCKKMIRNFYSCSFS